MPIHEYCCNKCSKEFEELIFKDDEPVNCPACGSDKVAKLISTCKFRTGGPIVAGSPSSNALTTRGSNPCSGCSGGDCSTC